MGRTDPRGRVDVAGRELGLARMEREGMVVRAGRRAGPVATLLLHGAAGSWTTWAPLLRAADRAGAPLTDLVIPDLPGWGESAGPVPPIAEVSSRLARLLRGLGYERWRIVGHSLGGFLALDLASRERGATLAVGLVSPTGPGVLAVARHPFASAATVPGFAGMRATMAGLAALRSSGHALARTLDRIGMLRLVAAPLFAHPGRVHRSAVSALAREIRPASFEAAVRQAAAYDASRWRRVDCPVLSVRGRRDVFAAPGESAALRELVPGLREVRLRGAGHFAHLEQPDATWGALGLGAAPPHPRDRRGSGRVHDDSARRAAPDADAGRPRRGGERVPLARPPRPV